MQDKLRSLCKGYIESVSDYLLRAGLFIKHDLHMLTFIL